MIYGFCMKLSWYFPDDYTAQIYWDPTCLRNVDLSMILAISSDCLISMGCACVCVRFLLPGTTYFPIVVFTTPISVSISPIQAPSTHWVFPHET